MSGLGGNMVLPAVHIGLCPGQPSSGIEFESFPGSSGFWLYKADDIAVVRILDEAAPLLVTSLGSDQTVPLEIEVQRIEESTRSDSEAGAAGESQSVSLRQGLPTQIITHVQYRGDLTFLEEPWAGLVGEGLWIEAFEIIPREYLKPDQIEYKALDAVGTETEWVKGGWTCGTRGLGVPLMGFAVRLSPDASIDDCEIEYVGRFLSGNVVGPARNGEPIFSPNSGDPIEAIHVAIMQSPRENSSHAPQNSEAGTTTKKPARRGARFGALREPVESVLN